MTDLDPSPTTVREQAVAACSDHAEAVFGAPLAVTIDSSEAQWDPLWLREVLVQRMTISRVMQDLEVIVDAAQRVVGFVDHEAPPANGWVLLDGAAAQALVVGTGIVPASAVIRSSRRSADDRLELQLQLPGGELRVARVDPVRGVVISIEPWTEGAPR
ncbi:MAG: hypothetical protein K0V04_02710 [Deltaproteobacteria bacterium]|nr:hypothetical protein [Deltaproteobacteria bacterium]